MNSFIDYLNSTNNAGTNTTGSLAEYQVKSRYFNVIRVDRQIGKYIAGCVRSNSPQAFILTGYAGDGKTSILAQVLSELGYLNSDGLSVEEEFPDFRYVKDMSEITKERQVSLLESILSAPKAHKTGLLISNTGPLLKVFESFVEKEYEKSGRLFTSDDKLKLQSTLLTQLDENSDKPLDICGYSFNLLNIARIDNVSFAPKLLGKIISPELWSDCQNCKCVGKCPIKHNRDIIENQFERVSGFIESYYRFLFENDKRMTIRQMMSQISFAITGNLTCADVMKRDLRDPFFRYNFANLFFGFCGVKPVNDALQIQGIREIQNLAPYHIALDVDYEIFVSQELRCFNEELRELLASKLRREYHKLSRPADDDTEDHKKLAAQALFRGAIRRFYLMYSLFDDEKGFDRLMDQIFGRLYSEYKALISSVQPKSQLNAMRAIVFNALYVRNTGALPDRKTDIPLTLRRDDNVFQNVMIVLGSVNRSKLSIIQKKAAGRFSDADDKQELYLRFGKSEFRLTLPMVNYFGSLIDGAIDSEKDPALSHGIAQLDALLLDNFGNDQADSPDSCELSLLISKLSGQEIMQINFDENNIDI